VIEQGRLDERDVACAEQDRPFVTARAQRVRTGDECLERPFPRIFDGFETGAGLGADGEDWVRYLRERARHANRETDAAEVDGGFVPAHAARRAPGEEEARRMTWLDQMTTSLAERTGVSADTLALTPETTRAILDVARVASHSSGERIYAPLLCYVLGMLSNRGIPLEQAIAIVNDKADQTGE
jgi:hypothetical protein